MKQLQWGPVPLLSTNATTHGSRCDQYCLPPGLWLKKQLIIAVETTGGVQHWQLTQQQEVHSGQAITQLCVTSCIWQCHHTAYQQRRCIRKARSA